MKRIGDAVWSFRFKCVGKKDRKNKRTEVTGTVPFKFVWIGPALNSFYIWLDFNHRSNARAVMRYMTHRGTSIHLFLIYPILFITSSSYFSIVPLNSVAFRRFFQFRRISRLPTVATTLMASRFHPRMTFNNMSFLTLVS